MDVNIDKYTDDLRDIDKMELRDYIGQGYQLAEELEWCNEDEDYSLNKRKEEYKNKSDQKQSIVPIISSEFSDHESARKAYTNLQRKTNNIEIEVYDVHYEKEDKKVTIILKPYSI